MQRNALILGMPRSGTSLTAGVLARQGYYVGRSRLSAIQNGDDHNPFGYFEADDVVERNLEIFRQVGFHFQNTWRFDLPECAARTIWDLKPTDSDRRFVTGYHQRAPWLWKDQRLCWTLPYWWQLMDPADTGVLLIRRDPEDIYRSFRRIGWCSREKAAKQRLRWLADRHLRAAEDAIRRLSIPFVEIDYEAYFKAPEKVAGRIGRFFGLELGPEDLNIRHELNHSRLRGRASTLLRIVAKKLPRKQVRRIEHLVPQWVLAKIFPERRYAPEPTSETVVTTRTLALQDVGKTVVREIAQRMGRDPLTVAIEGRRAYGRSLPDELEDRLSSPKERGADVKPVKTRDEVIGELSGELTISLRRREAHPAEKYTFA